METVLFGYFFSRSRFRKIQTAKTQEEKKRKGFELVQNRNERGKHACLEKRSSINFTDFLIY